MLGSLLVFGIKSSHFHKVYILERIIGSKQIKKHNFYEENKVL